MPRRFHHSIRFKLLLVSLTLLGIPWAGYRFIHETEQFLRDAQQQSLQGTAQALSKLVAKQAEGFTGQHLPGQANHRTNLYLHRWELAPVIDGYPDEWTLFEGNFTRYRLPDGSLGLELAAGEHAGQAYLLLRVSDTSRAYGTQGDRVDLSLSDGTQLTRLRIQPRAPGWIMGQRLQGRRFVAEPALRGEWQETDGGYVV